MGHGQAGDARGSDLIGTINPEIASRYGYTWWSAAGSWRAAPSRRLRIRQLVGAECIGGVRQQLPLAPRGLVGMHDEALRQLGQRGVLPDPLPALNAGAWCRRGLPLMK